MGAATLVSKGIFIDSPDSGIEFERGSVPNGAGTSFVMDDGDGPPLLSPPKYGIFHPDDGGIIRSNTALQ